MPWGIDPIWLMQCVSVTLGCVGVILDMSQAHHSTTIFLHQKIEHHTCNPPGSIHPSPSPSLHPNKQASVDFSNFCIYVGVNELFWVLGIV